MRMQLAVPAAVDEQPSGVQLRSSVRPLVRSSVYVLLGKREEHQWTDISVRTLLVSPQASVAHSVFGARQLPSATMVLQRNQRYPYQCIGSDFAVSRLLPWLRHSGLLTSGSSAEQQAAQLRCFLSFCFTVMAMRLEGQPWVQPSMENFVDACREPLADEAP